MLVIVTILKLRTLFLIGYLKKNLKIANGEKDITDNFFVNGFTNLVISQINTPHKVKRILCYI